MHQSRSNKDYEPAEITMSDSESDDRADDSDGTSGKRGNTKRQSKNVNQNRQDNKRRVLLIAIYLPTQLLQPVKVTVTEAMRPARVWSLAR